MSDMVEELGAWQERLWAEVEDRLDLGPGRNPVIDLTAPPVLFGERRGSP